jgi:hypothetical protein
MRRAFGEGEGLIWPLQCAPTGPATLIVTVPPGETVGVM